MRKSEFEGRLEAAKSYETCKAHSGWHSECRRSPSPSEESIPAEIKKDYSAIDDGWELARERSPKSGYRYALMPGCTRPGFAGVAERTWWRLIRRRAN